VGRPRVMRRPLLLVGVGLTAAAAVAAVAVAGRLLFHDTSRPASVTAALRVFRSEVRHPAAGEGVYLYRTAGGESLSVLNGTAHAYPATTTVALVRADCGVQLHWQALAERSTTWLLCRNAHGIVMRSSDEVHTFFGQTDRTDYRCSGAWPSGGPSGMRRPFACSSKGGRERGFAVVVGRSVLVVGGTRVDAVHIRTTSVVSGGNHGTETSDWWLARDSAAPVRIALSSRTSRTIPILGTAHYREHAVLALESLDPLR